MEACARIAGRINACLFCFLYLEMVKDAVVALYLLDIFTLSCPIVFVFAQSMSGLVVLIQGCVLFSETVI